MPLPPTSLPPRLRDLAQRSAAPAAVVPWLEQVLEAGGAGGTSPSRSLAGRLTAGDEFAPMVVTLVAASRSLARLIATDQAATAVLASLDEPAEGSATTATAEELARWKHLELL